MLMWSFGPLHRSPSLKRPQEADGAPGLVLDAYGGRGVAAFDGRGADAFWRPRWGSYLGSAVVQFSWSNTLMAPSIIMKNTYFGA